MHLSQDGTKFIMYLGLSCSFPPESPHKNWFALAEIHCNLFIYLVKFLSFCLTNSSCKLSPTLSL